MTPTGAINYPANSRAGCKECCIYAAGLKLHIFDGVLPSREDKELNIVFLKFKASIREQRMLVLHLNYRP